MRTSLVPSVVAALLFLAGTFPIPCSAHDATTDQTPTFYRLFPGTYVNGWPRFTVTYPKDWVEVPCMIAGGEVFKVLPKRKALSGEHTSEE